MRSLAFVVLPALLLLTTGEVRADGISVRKRVTLDELAQTSDAIFTATLLETDPQWASREAYGRNQRYVQHYRFRIKITAWLKGKAKLPAKGKLWLGYRGDPVPGKWMIVEEQYDSSFQPRMAKAGDRVVVFASSANIENLDVYSEKGRAMLHPRAIDVAGCSAAVKAVLARAPTSSSNPDAAPER